MLILIGFAASGFAATTFEVSWTRLLAMVMGSSVYAFGTLVVVVLAGLGIGSAVYSLTLRTATVEEHRRWFAILEFLIAFTGGSLVDYLPRIPFLFIRYFPLFRGCISLADRCAFRCGGAVGAGSFAVLRRNVSGSAGQPRRRCGIALAGRLARPMSRTRSEPSPAPRWPGSC